MFAHAQSLITGALAFEISIERENIVSKIYLFGGIGCGENIFGRMSWPEGYDVRFVGWKEPLPGEDFSGYCARIVRGEEFTEHDILFGVSLGGIAALEIAAACPNIKTVVLVSSAADVSEYSPLLRFFARYVPAWAVPLRLLEYDRVKSFLVTGSADRKYALRSAGFFVPLGKRYYRMALEAVKNHDGTLYGKIAAAGCRVLRIHGSGDALFPVVSRGENVRTVKNGTHLMVYMKAREVSSALKDILEAQGTVIP